MEVTVFDEDRDYSFDFLGTVHIPLLKILDGQKKWYILKDSKLRSKAKGNNARILMELNVIWNPVSVFMIAHFISQFDVLIVLIK